MSTSTAPNRDVDPSLRSPPTSLDEELTLPAELQHTAPGQRVRVAGASHFFRHLIEMVLAMMVGMMALGALDRGLLAAAGTSVTHVRNSAPEVVALVMAFNMTVGMTVWMRHRRHSWAMCAEMGGAMFVPALVAIVLLWCAVLHGGSIATVEMTAMFPAMIAVMLLRRSDYSQPVRAHSAHVKKSPRSHAV